MLRGVFRGFESHISPTIFNSHTTTNHISKDLIIMPTVGALSRFAYSFLTKRADSRNADGTDTY